MMHMVHQTTRATEAAFNLQRLTSNVPLAVSAFWTQVGAAAAADAMAEPLQAVRMC